MRKGKNAFFKHTILFSTYSLTVEATQVERELDRYVHLWVAYEYSIILFYFWEARLTVYGVVKSAFYFIVCAYTA